jgi:hypothetical protein
MGISIGHNWSCSGLSPSPASPSRLWDKNPDAKNFNITAAFQVDNFVIAKIKYPNCINFEGDKIMVYRGITLKELMNRVEIDPHFKDGDRFSPIARFTPTTEGWQIAEMLVEQLKRK